MVFLSRYIKKCRVAYLRVGLLAIALSALFIPSLRPVKSVGNNIFTLYVNGQEIGRVDDEKTADKITIDARREVVGDAEDMVLIEAETKIVGAEVLVGKTDDIDTMKQKVIDIYKSSIKETMQHAYSVKIDDYMVNLSSAEEVTSLLEASIERFAPGHQFSASLVADSVRKLPVYLTNIEKTVEPVIETGPSVVSDYLDNDGIFKQFDAIVDAATPEEETTFEDYEYGVVSVSFVNNVEVVESYLSQDQISPLQDAIDEITKDKEQKTIYEVVAGDTLSGISKKTGISIDQIIELNENITSTSSIIRIGDEITVTVPEPELSIAREELVYYEGTYEADIIYKYNDSWYTTTEVVLQQPSSGYHKAVEKKTFLNSKETSSEVIYEEVIAEAVPKIIEKGTKIPPTYIKPISGGRQTDGYGYRGVVIKGMSGFHAAIDWATPTGTSVVASCGGKVTYAGWRGTYGNVIFITHPDGKETRYAHLSKVLVSKGDYVSQGQKIGLSGNTGASTGPHLHFEMRVNGVAVNPYKYLSK